MSQPKPINDNNTTRIAVLETNVAHIHETMERIERGMNNNFHEIRKEMLDARKETWSQFRWIMGAVFFGIFIPIVLKGFHWL